LQQNVVVALKIVVIDRISCSGWPVEYNSRDRESQLEYPDIIARTKTSLRMAMQKTQFEKGLERFTQKFQGENQAVQKKVLASKQNKEGGKLHETPSTKEVWILIAHTSKA
jgi:hypothetical protein